MFSLFFSFIGIRYLWKRALCFSNCVFLFVKKGQSSHWYLCLCFPQSVLYVVLKSHFGHWYLFSFLLSMILCMACLCIATFEALDNIEPHKSQGTLANSFFLWTLIAWFRSDYSDLKDLSQVEHLMGDLHIFLWCFNEEGNFVSYFEHISHFKRKEELSCGCSRDNIVSASSQLISPWNQLFSNRPSLNLPSNIVSSFKFRSFSILVPLLFTFLGRVVEFV